MTQNLVTFGLGYIQTHTKNRAAPLWSDAITIFTVHRSISLAHSTDTKKLHFWCGRLESLQHEKFSFQDAEICHLQSWIHTNTHTEKLL
jgi:hypothetical protein